MSVKTCSQVILCSCLCIFQPSRPQLLSHMCTCLNVLIMSAVCLCVVSWLVCVSKAFCPVEGRVHKPPCLSIVSRGFSNSRLDLWCGVRVILYNSIKQNSCASKVLKKYGVLRAVKQWQCTPCLQIHLLKHRWMRTCQISSHNTHTQLHFLVLSFSVSVSSLVN